MNRDEFFHACVNALNLTPGQLRFINGSERCRIRTGRGWVQHFEWSAARRNRSLEVGIHFESVPHNNVEWLAGVMPFAGAIESVVQGQVQVEPNRGEIEHWARMYVSRDIVNGFTPELLTWAVETMRVFRTTLNLGV